VVVLRFYFFSLPITVVVFSFNFFHAKSELGAACGGVAFPKGEVLLNPYRLEKRGFPLFSFYVYVFSWCFICFSVLYCLVYGVRDVMCVCVRERAAADVVCVLPGVACACFG
jgi:hypothetical protein